jgi:hypothetical protein
MCLPSILVLGLDLQEKLLLRREKAGHPFGVATLNQYGGVSLAHKLQSLGLVVRSGFDPKYGRARWAVTRCGQAAASLLNELEKYPMLRDAILDDYKRQMTLCPNTKPQHRTNPNCCQCRF